MKLTSSVVDVNNEDRGAPLRNDLYFQRMPVLAERIKTLRNKKGWSQADLATNAGLTQQAIDKIEKGETQRTRFINEIALALGTSWQYLMGKTDDPIVQGARKPDAIPAPRVGALGQEKDLPVYASASGGPDASAIELVYEAVEWIERPPMLQGVVDAFAMYVVNDSMEPRFSHGDILWIHPSKPVSPGHSVLIVLRDGDGTHVAYVKKLVKITDKEVVFEQLNPPQKRSFKRADVASIRRIVGVAYE